MDGITTDDHVTIAPAQATIDSGRHHVIAITPSSAPASRRRQAAGSAHRAGRTVTASLMRIAIIATDDNSDSITTTDTACDHCGEVSKRNAMVTRRIRRSSASVQVFGSGGPDA